MKISLLHRKESIVISTIEVLNEVGLQNLSTKLIAKHEGVSEGTLFRHFKNKTEIISAVVDYYSKFDCALIETSIRRKLSAIETIRYFVSSYAEYYENYPEITVIAQSYDALMYDTELSNKVKLIINKRFNFICKTLKKAQETGIISSNMNCNLLADLIIGGCRNICLKWRMEKYQFSIKDRTLEMLEIIINQYF